MTPPSPGPLLSDRVARTPSSATVRIADLATELRRQGVRVLDFSAGRAAEPSPDYVNQAAARALLSGDTHQTMAQGRRDFRVRVSEKLRRENGLDMDPDRNVIATLGCKNGLTLALMSILDPGDEAVIEDPCFVSYGATVGLFGARSVAVPLRAENAFRWTREQLEGAITERTKVLLFCSPHNPCGAVHTAEDLDVIAETALRHRLWVVADEIYERVTWGGRRHICLSSRPGMRDRVVGLMGFTKTLSMGGWRIGFAYGPERIIGAMTKLQQHLMTCAGSFTQAGAASALADDYRPEVYALWSDWEKRCAFVADEINRIPGLSCRPPEGGFYAWIDIRPAGESSAEFCERLLEERHIALVPGSAFGSAGEGYVRMTCVKSWDDLKEGLALMRQGIR